jgi:hypothetical protein
MSNFAYREGCVIMGKVILVNNIKAIAIHLCMCLAYSPLIFYHPRTIFPAILIPTIVFALYTVIVWKFLRKTNSGIVNLLSIMTVVLLLPFSLIASLSRAIQFSFAIALTFTISPFVDLVDFVVWSNGNYLQGDARDVTWVIFSLVPFLAMLVGMALKKRPGE